MIKKRFWDQKKIEWENRLYHLFRGEFSGMGTVEIILIIVVLVGLVLVFKTQITNLVNSIFSRITSQANQI